MHKCISWLSDNCKFAKKKSWMIAAYPDAASSRLISNLKKELDLHDAEEVFEKAYYHVTLRYWKSEDEELAEAVQGWLKENIPPVSIECEASGLEILGDKDSLVITLKSKDLNDKQKKIDEGIQALGVDPSDFPVFKAHLTLAQGLEKAPKLPKNFKITLNTWKFTNKDEEVLWQCSNR